MNLRQTRKDETRRALVDAALGLFAEHGFDRTTVDDLVDRAGVSRRTYFRYFRTKEAVFFAHHEARLQAFVADVTQRTPTFGSWVAVREGLLAVAGAYHGDREGALVWRRILQTSADLVARDLELDLAWEKAVAAAFVRDGASPFEAAVRAGAVMGVVRAVLGAWYEREGRDDLVAMGRQAFRWLEAGLRTEVRPDPRGRATP